jgi:hypothetical protein
MFSNEMISQELLQIVAVVGRKSGLLFWTKVDHENDFGMVALKMEQY